ncbi:MAG: hypothetical protein ACREGH_02160 [Minisyncoccia bacterium]
MDRAQVGELLRTAVWAPSGDNSQPWKFAWDGSRLEVWMLPEKDHPILNAFDRGTLIAHGALLANIELLAATYGTQALTELFPDTEQQNLLARIAFGSHSGNTSPLAADITRRHTNRRPYDTVPAITRKLEEVMRLAGSSINTHVREMRMEDRQSVGNALSVMEEIALATPELHRLFFADILWSPKEAERGVPGLPLISLELPPPARLLLRVLRHWLIMQTLNKIGFNRVIAKANATVYRESGAFVAFTLPDKTRESYIACGRELQYFWLAATHAGLSCQPVTGVIFVAELLKEGVPLPLRPVHGTRAEEAYGTIRQCFGISPEKTIGMLLRVGVAQPPSGYCERLAPAFNH